MIRSFFSRLYTTIVQAVDQKVGWHRLPLLIALAMLFGLRIILRERNLYDTRTLPLAQPHPPAAYAQRFRIARTPDGTYNDLCDPAMGSAREAWPRGGPAGPPPRATPPQPRTGVPASVSPTSQTRMRDVPVA